MTQRHENSGGAFGPGEPGGAAEEASRLVDALGEWLAGRASGFGSHRGSIANGSAECRLCPLCQLIGVLRDHRPEIAGHLDDAMTSLLAALRAALTAVEEQRSDGDGSSSSKLTRIPID